MLWPNFIFKRRQSKKIKVYSFSHKNIQFINLLIKRLYQVFVSMIYSVFTRLSGKLLVSILFKMFFSYIVFVKFNNNNTLYLHFFSRYMNVKLDQFFICTLTYNKNTNLFFEFFNLYVLYCYSNFISCQLINEEKLSSSALPYNYNYYTLLRSPHTDKKSREQFISMDAVLLLSKVRYLDLIKNILIHFNIKSFVTNQIKFINS